MATAALQYLDTTTSSTSISSNNIRYFHNIDVGIMVFWTSPKRCIHRITKLLRVLLFMSLKYVSDVDILRMEMKNTILRIGWLLAPSPAIDFKLQEPKNGSLRIFAQMELLIVMVLQPIMHPNLTAYMLTCLNVCCHVLCRG